MLANADEQCNRVGYLAMLVKASIGISNHLGGIEWELAEVVFLNQFRVDVTSAGSRVKEGSD